MVTQNGLQTRKQRSRTWNRVGQAYPVHRCSPPPFHRPQMMSWKYTISYTISYTMSYTISYRYVVYDIVYYIRRYSVYSAGRPAAVGQNVAVWQKSHACGGDVEGRWSIPKRKHVYILDFRHCRGNLHSDSGLETRTNRF